MTFLAVLQSIGERIFGVSVKAETADEFVQLFDNAPTVADFKQAVDGLKTANETVSQLTETNSELTAQYKQLVAIREDLTTQLAIANENAANFKTKLEKAELEVAEAATKLATLQNEVVQQSQTIDTLTHDAKILAVQIGKPETVQQERFLNTKPKGTLPVTSDKYNVTQSGDGSLHFSIK